MYRITTEESDSDYDHGYGDLLIEEELKEVYDQPNIDLAHQLRMTSIDDPVDEAFYPAGEYVASIEDKNAIAVAVAELFADIAAFSRNCAVHWPSDDGYMDWYLLLLTQVHV